MEILSSSQIVLRSVSLSEILALYTGVNISHRRFKFCPVTLLIWLKNSN